MRRVRVLVVEDNIGDVELLVESLEGSVIPVELSAVEGGREALRFLRRDPPHERATRPDLVLVDVNMPGMSGLELLEALRADPELSKLTCVVLSSSSCPDDERRSYELDAREYLVKPKSFGELTKLATSLTPHLTEAARLPL